MAFCHDLPSIEAEFLGCSIGECEAVMFRSRFLPLTILMTGCQAQPSVDGTFTAAAIYDADGDGQTPAGGDCDDTNAYIYAGAPEYCDGWDNDCDELVDDMDPSRIGLVWMFDGDVDGWGKESSPGEAQYLTACSVDTFEELVENTGGDPDLLVYYVQAQYDADGEILVDCDDTNANVNPDETEVCDGWDNDCNELVDDGVPSPTTFYPDVDGDLYGDSFAIPVEACSAPVGYVSDATDCNDDDSAVNPAATEVCDAADVDEDCNSLADDNDAGVDPTTQTDWYVDDDNDGYGDPPPVTTACDDPSDQLVLDGTDCDDSNADRFPGNPEICDGLDNDCDLAVPDSETDDDGDLWSECQGDCDDSEDERFPANPELCDGLDNDCDGTGEVDGDLDTYLSCAECDDSNAARFPGNPELCDGLDNDCDLALPPEETSDDGDPLAECQGDCDDTNANVYPGAPELCDDQDSDCDLEVDEDAVDQVTWSRDRDGDLYGDPSEPTFTSCDAPSGYTQASGDCDDFSSAVNPGATEIFNEIDDDCDGEVDEGTSCMTTIVIVNDGGETISIDGTVSDDGSLSGEWYPSGVTGVSVTPTSLGGNDWEYESSMDLCITTTGSVLVDAQFEDGSFLCEGMGATAIVYGTMDAIDLDVLAYDNGDGTCQVELTRP
ncbi:hypothetical protein EPN81_04355 [Patescibacteria group bacterium]|nr:MAG: hypothetical protein EPN81_04355 [Patescibacteria group bacterium]